MVTDIDDRHCDAGTDLAEASINPSRRDADTRPRLGSLTSGWDVAL